MDEKINLLKKIDLNQINTAELLTEMETNKELSFALTKYCIYDLVNLFLFSINFCIAFEMYERYNGIKPTSTFFVLLISYVIYTIICNFCSNILFYRIQFHIIGCIVMILTYMGITFIW